MPEERKNESLSAFKNSERGHDSLNVNLDFGNSGL